MNLPEVGRFELKSLLAWGLVLAAGTWLRFWQLGTQLLIDDEWHAIHRLLQADYGDILLSMGYADYSIPLTLLFRFLADTVGLDDFALRLLPMTFGIATIVLVPRLLSPWLDRRQQLVLAALIAFSPLLIHFSRYVRPYALVVPLGFAALVGFWRWSREGGFWRGALSSLAAVMAIWLHALAALFVGAALLWLAAAAAIRWRRGAGVNRLLNVLLLGGVTTLLSAALVLPPLISNPGVIGAKAGLNAYTAETVLRSWEMIAGLESPWLACALLVPAGAGTWALGRRAPAFVGYWVFTIAAAAIAIQLLGPEWIQNALVLVRYMAIAVPFLLALVAIGIVEFSDRAIGRLAGDLAIPFGTLAGLALAAALYVVGPLPHVYSGNNAFTNSVRYQVDYDFERSVFNPHFAPLALPQAYRRMMAEPGDWTVVEAAWHFETHHTPISEYQRRHQLPVKIGMISGLCTDWTWGELDPSSSLSVSLAHFVFLDQIIESPPESPHFVVFHRDSPFDETRELPDLAPCIEAFESRFGRPWHETDGIVVFRLPGRGPADGS